MMLETELENKMIAELSAISQLSSCQFIGSRQVADSDDEVIADRDDVDSIIAIHTGYRQNDAFSLTPISVPMSIQMTTRVERDKSGMKHEEVVEKISDKLSYWHKFSDDFTNAFNLTKMFCGEMKIDGGSGRIYNDDKRIWTENISFTIRGSERYLTTD